MASSLLLAFFSVVVLVEAGVLLDDPETRIIGGHEIEIKDVPWQIALLENGKHNCGGSIISPRWIVSAAHCTYGKNVSKLEILVGSNSLKEGGTKYLVEEVVNHENYNDNLGYSNDICVLKTKTDMKLDLLVKAVALPGPDAPRPAVKTQLRVSGWGLAEYGLPPDILRAVDVVVRDFTECKPDDNPTEICAGTSGKGACTGDSGGPLVKGDVLVGVVSHYVKGGCSKGFDIYMNVASFRNWIQNHTGI